MRRPAVGSLWKTGVQNSPQSGPQNPQAPCRTPLHPPLPYALNRRVRCVSHDGVGAPNRGCLFPQGYDQRGLAQKYPAIPQILERPRCPTWTNKTPDPRPLCPIQQRTKTMHDAAIGFVGVPPRAGCLPYLHPRRVHG